MEKTNPLSQYYRQPQIYIALPSGGKFYGSDVVDTSPNKEYAVLPMTAVDEMAFKMPDSLMNGQSTVDVIRSCIPAIKDPWSLVNYDIDTVLIAIRIASYGETMEVTAGVPNTNEQVTHSVNLPQMLDQIKAQKISNECQLSGGLKIKIKPLTYKQITEAQLKTFEQQRIYSQVSQSELTVEEKTKRFSDSFKQLNALNSQLLIDNIDEIVLPSGEGVKDSAHIREFIDNADARLTKELENKLIEIRQQGSIKPFRVNATEEQIKNGAPSTYEVPVTFDNANFFV
jgi:hypothetical protein